MYLFHSRKYLEWNWGVESFLQGYTESKEKNADRDFLIPLLLEDNLPVNLPAEIQAHMKTKRYIDARNLKQAKDIGLFQKKLLFAMPKVPLKNMKKEKEPEELHLNNWRFKPPPLFYRIYKYNAWNTKTAPNKQQHDQVRNQDGAAGIKRAVKRANIEVDPEDPEYFDENEYNGPQNLDNNDDNDSVGVQGCEGSEDESGTDGGGNGDPRVVVVEADVHAQFWFIYHLYINCFTVWAMQHNHNLTK